MDLRRVLIAMALLASLLAPTPGSAADAASPVPCSRFVSGAPDDAECFEVVVPTWHDGRDETTQVLSVLILRSRAARPEPDPVVYLAGGPGGSAIETVNLWFGSPIRATRDIILVEQRGTRFSRPFLACPEQTNAQLYVASVAISPEEHVDAISAATDDCRERLEADQADAILGLEQAVEERGRLGQLGLEPGTGDVVDGAGAARWQHRRLNGHGAMVRSPRQANVRGGLRDLD
jgi:hypothetical protein